MRPPSASEDGQAAVEAIALVPLLILVVLAAWQLAAVGLAALRADEILRRKALVGHDSRSGLVEVTARSTVQQILPLVGRYEVEARGAVRTR